MDQKPLFLTTFALGRLLKGFAQVLGNEPVYADVLAQVYLQRSDSHTAWSSFIQTNCAGCAKTPESCNFLNPSPESCVEGATPETVQSAYAVMIETGRLTHCQAFVPFEEPHGEAP